MKKIFVVLEGIDKSGKTTISKLLAEKLKAKEINFPDRTTDTGKLIDSYLRKNTKLPPQSIHLLFSANRWEVAKKIETILEQSSLVCDRYYYSGVVYSLTNGVEYEWAKQADIGLPEPDLVAFIDIKPENVGLRESFGEEVFENLEFQQRVYNNYIRIFSEKENVEFFDGSLTPVEIADNIFNFITTEC